MYKTIKDVYNIRSICTKLYYMYITLDQYVQNYNICI